MIVRGADTARLDLAPEAPGLLAASLGLSRMYADDLAQLEAGMALYDAFYRWCRDATDETHNWPAKPGREHDRTRIDHRRRATRRAHPYVRARRAGLGSHRRALLRRPGRPDRGDAPHPRRGEALDLGERGSCMR